MSGECPSWTHETMGPFRLLGSLWYEDGFPQPVSSSQALTIRWFISLWLVNVSALPFQDWMGSLILLVYPQEEIDDDQSALFAHRPDSLNLDEVWPGWWHSGIPPRGEADSQRNLPLYFYIAVATLHDLTSKDRVKYCNYILPRHCNYIYIQPLKGTYITTQLQLFTMHHLHCLELFNY